MTVRSLVLATFLPLLLLAGPARALDILPYSAEALGKAQAADKPVALHFHADWCPTCRAQAKAFDTLRAEPGLAITLLVVDYDKERELKAKLGVRSQSTLIVYRGSRETHRLGGATDPAALKAALASAL